MALAGLFVIDASFNGGCDRSGAGEALTQALNTADGEVSSEALAGLWSRYQGQSEGDPVRFWYFHGDGHGLYRYGRVGYTNTHSFDYSVRGTDLELRFRKSGERVETKLEIEGEGEARRLRFAHDPREPGAEYDFARGPISGESAPEASAIDDGPFSNHMWIDYKQHATGGAAFALYQFGPAAIDGRGVGWFHEGDFDEWRTEAMSFRVDGERLELFFDLNEELGTTRFEIEGKGDRRKLHLAQDPRDFWLSHRYKDAGRSFLGPNMLLNLGAGETQ